MIGRVLVLGGAGFIGCHLVKKLVTIANEVIVYDNLSTGQLKNLCSLSDIKFIEGDILDQDKLFSIMRGIDIVYHMAAKTSVVESLQDPLTVHEVNNTGTLNVLLASLKCNVSRLILASSCAVYGDAHCPPLKESYYLSPKSLYAATKANLEAMAESFYHSYQLEYVALRLFNVYGQGQNAESEYAAVIPKFIKCYQMKESPTIFGDGLQTRDFIYVGDVVDGLIRASTIDKSLIRQHRIFNLGSGVPMSIKNILSVIAKAMGYELEVRYQPPRPGEIRHSYADMELSRRYGILVDITPLTAYLAEVLKGSLTDKKRS